MEIKSGQIIQIQKNNYVVVETSITRSKNSLNGNFSYAHHFNAVPKDDFFAGKENLKEKKWTIKDLSSIHGPNEIRLKNIKIVDKVNFKKQTTVKYVVM
jgi:hypothetical protein